MQAVRVALHEVRSVTYPMPLRYLLPVLLSIVNLYHRARQVLQHARRPRRAIIRRGRQPVVP